jgi:hypothetical protein
MALPEVKGLLQQAIRTRDFHGNDSAYATRTGIFSVLIFSPQIAGPVL